MAEYCMTPASFDRFRDLILDTDPDAIGSPGQIPAAFLLARAGFTSELRIGVKKTDGRFEAHAWLECPDNIIIGNPSPEGKQYSRLPALGKFCA